MIHFISTRPTCRPCANCHRLLLTGIDEGLPYRVDPAPLTALGELSARLTGRRSYALVASWLAHRTAGRIRMDGSRGRPIVFADHRCRTPPAARDLDAQHAPAIGRLIAALTAPDTDDTADENALFLLATDLGGRVIGLTDNQTPPF
jgi:hypothetical protein